MLYPGMTSRPTSIRPAVAWAGAALLALPLAACTGASAHPATMHTIACPEDVELHLVVRHDCLRLRVPENRAEPKGRTLDLLVVRVHPTHESAPDPVLNLGSETGDSLGYGGFAALAEREQRTAYLLQPRGSGLSTPSMSCPEAKSIRATDVDEGAELGTAARACLKRLRAAGDDPALFSPVAVAADAEDLRKAIHAKTWNVITYGSTSVYAAALVHLNPAAVRTLVLDSPAPLTGSYGSASATWAAWERLVGACMDDPKCGATGVTTALWSEAAARVGQGPLAVPGGAPVSLSVEALARLVRSTLAGEGPARTASLPALLLAVRDGVLLPDTAALLHADADACLGIRPLCSHANSLADYLSAMCPLVTGRSDAATPPVLGAKALDLQSSYATACAGWPTSATSSALPPSLPVLVMAGAFDPFVDPGTLASWGNGPHTYVVTVPEQTHNTLGFDDCPISMRNAWVDHPDAAPTTQCFASMPRLPFAQALQAEPSTAIPPPSTSPTATATTSQASGATSSLMGTWQTPDLPAAAWVATYRRAGASPEEIAQFSSGLGTTQRIVLRISGTDWVEFESEDGDPPTQGWAGTYVQSGSQARLTATDVPLPCYYTYELSFTGKAMRVQVLTESPNREPDCGANDLRIQRALYQTAAFTKVG